MDPFCKSSFDLMLDTLPSLSKEMMEFDPSAMSFFPGFESATGLSLPERRIEVSAPQPLQTQQGSQQANATATVPTFYRAISDVYAHVGASPVNVGPGLPSPTKGKASRASKAHHPGPIKPIQHQNPKHPVLDNTDSSPISPTSSHAALESSLEGGESSEKRRERNRIAQRRFRERQRSTVTTLQVELETMQAESSQVKARIKALEQANQALAAKLNEYEQAFGALADCQPAQ